MLGENLMEGVWFWKVPIARQYIHFISLYYIKDFDGRVL